MVGKREKDVGEAVRKPGWSHRERHYMPVALRAEQAVELRRLAEQRDCSQASLIRRGVDLVLKEAGDGER